MESLEVKILDEISREHLETIFEDLTEVTLDSLMQDGVLKEIPIIATVVGLLKTSNNIREKIFAKKLLNFFYALKDIPIKKRIDFIQRLDETKGFKKKVGETIIVLLEQIDNLEKPKIIGNLFKAYILENISFHDFSKISSSVNRINLDDLVQFFESTRTGIKLPQLIKENLAFNGLMSATILEQALTFDMTHISPDLDYFINEFGEKLIKYGFNNYAT
jgi:hypothetical protein